MRRFAPHAITLVFVLVIAELMCFLVVRYGGEGMRFLRHNPNLDDPKRMDDYLARRDPTLGWRVTPSEAVHVDESGARLSPAYPEPGSACVSVYGDSFAFGSDASDDDAWANVLAKKLGCRVANFGTPGYGTDQALIRFEQNTTDEAPIVVLTIFPDNVVRSLTNFIWLVVLPTFDYRGQKPRFALDARGELELHPLPYRTREELLAFVEAPHAKLDNEFLKPTGHYARNRYMSFPYLYSMIQFFSGDRFLSIMRLKLSGKPVNEDYLRPGHPSRSFELTLAILERFVKTADTRGKKVIVVMLPDREIVAQYRAKKIWSYGELIDRTGELATVINMGEYFSEQLGARRFLEIEHPGGHYTTEGYAMVAERVRIEIARLSARP